MLRDLLRKLEQFECERDVALEMLAVADQEIVLLNRRIALLEAKWRVREKVIMKLQEKLEDLELELESADSVPWPPVQFTDRFDDLIIDSVELDN